MNRGKYICFEGSEGVGKTTQVSLLVNYLRDQGHRVVQTKEPGTDHSPLTLELRKLILDAQYDDQVNGWAKLDQKISAYLADLQFASDHTDISTTYLKAAQLLIVLHKRMTTESREFILQAVRSIHLQKVVAPKLMTHDYIIQDRGILSGLAYGESGGVNETFMHSMNDSVVIESGIGSNWKDCYDQIIMLQGNVTKGLARAQSAKKEFETDDVMEKRGVSFLEKVNANFSKHLKDVKHATIIQVDNKTINQIHEEIKGTVK